MHGLIVVGRWEPIADDVAPLPSRQLREFQKQVRIDGIRTVRSPGALRHDCPENPAVGASKDCFVYRVAGRQVIPVVGVRGIEARFRLWVAYEDGAWQVVNYDYDVTKAPS